MNEELKGRVKSIGAEIARDEKNNDHYTQDPMFCLNILVRDAGYDSRYVDNKCWWNPYDMEWVYDDDTQQRKMDLGFDENSDKWEGPFGYVDRYETVMVALTREGIMDYMDRDGHNVRRRAFRGETHVYVESFGRCQEMIDLRKFLMGLSKENQDEESEQSVSHIPPLVRLNNVLFFVKASMDHPRMDSSKQWYEIANKVYEIAKDKEVRHVLRRAMDELR